jgi:hypothetical protein
MSKVNGKRKGNAFELKVANRLSNRFKEFLNIEKGFRRNQDSGSFFGGKNSDRIAQYDANFIVLGDLVCPKNFKYSVECKHYKTPPTFQSVLNQEIKEWDTWISQAERDSSNSNKIMMLIIKYNNVDEFIISDQEIDKITYAFRYKKYYVYKEKDFLSLDDNFYFDQ